MDTAPALTGAYRGKIYEKGNQNESLLLTATQLCSSFFSQRDILYLRGCNKKINEIVHTQLSEKNKLKLFKNALERNEAKKVEYYIQEFNIDVNSGCIEERDNFFGRNYIRYIIPLIFILEVASNTNINPIETIEVLLKAGADTNDLYNLYNIIYNSPYYLCELFDLLIKYNLNINRRELYTFLDLSIRTSNIDFFNFLLEKGVDKEIKNYRGDTSYNYCASFDLITESNYRKNPIKDYYNMLKIRHQMLNTLIKDKSLFTKIKLNSMFYFYSLINMIL
jgi:hypothetical protein